MEPPLLDLTLAEQFYATMDENERRELRSMLADFAGDATQRFHALHAALTHSLVNTSEAQENLHGLRGVTGNYGFRRSAERLRALEVAWASLPPAEISRELHAAQADLQAGMNSLRQHYPYLEI